MGLDMYAIITRRDVFTPDDLAPDCFEELHYWRKHPNLHGWMEQVYRKRLGGVEEFNCVLLRLTADDIDQLELAVAGRQLPHTDGMFFGESDGSELAHDLEFVEKARSALNGGYHLYYTAWW
jgi:hypothetical protein